MQAGWTVHFEAEVEADEVNRPPSQFVTVTVTHDLEVTDETALRKAVEELHGPPKDDIDRQLREHPANLIGLLLLGPLSLPIMPGVERRGTGMGIGGGEAP